MATNTHTRRRFDSAWDEIRYLYDKLLHWFYGKQNRLKALPFAKRLKPLLRKASADHGAVFGEECWSLVYETEGNLAKAIVHRQSEIEQRKKLRKMSVRQPYEDVVLAGYGIADLSDRYDLLAILFHDAGELDCAIQALEESRRLCKENKVRFDGQDLLDEFIAERQN